ncbi:MAG: hypothetical protein ACI4K9_04500 [Candidatus Fimenecus sp.]
MDITSLLDTLLQTLADLGIDFDAIGAALEPIISQIMGLIGM